MIENLVVENYRAFDRFEMSELGRINLIVGENNSGKTALLEAIYTVASSFDPQALWAIASRRGEFFVDESEPGYRRPSEIDVRHWFRGFDFEPGSTIRLAFTADGQRDDWEILVVPAPVEVQRRLFPPKTRTTSSGTTTTTSDPNGWPFPPDTETVEPPSVPDLALQIAKKNASESRVEAISTRGGARFDARRLRLSDRQQLERGLVFVPTTGLLVAQVAQMLDDINLTEEETIALRAMQMLDPRIEKVAPKGRDGRPRIMVRMTGTDRPLPIGCLGDGVNRLLTIAVALARADNGILLIDEIDTGLHFTALARMWGFVRAVAEKLNVQVFATTHSYDCVHALASICKEDELVRNVSIQRIRKNSPHAIAYTEEEVIAVARRNIEVR